MIKKFGFRNIYCFKEYSEISFELDNNVPNNISGGKHINTVIGIKGSNGSGKTNIIKALSFFFRFCLDEMTLIKGKGKGKGESKDLKEIPFRPFIGSSDSTEFNIEIEVDDVTYIYELELTTKKIISESLIRKIGREVVLFERSENDIVKCIKNYSELENINLRDDQSIISVIDKFKFKQKFAEIAVVNRAFVLFFSNVNEGGYLDFSITPEDISRRYHDSPGSFEFVKKILIAADSGIHNVEIKSREDEDGNEIYFPIFIHKNNDRFFATTYKDESSGTKELFKKLFLYWFILDNGGVLALDEFDIHVHANILPLLLDLFLEGESNPKNAQLIFTAHNTEIINKLGRYMAILVNKEESESYCYRLDEIKGTMLRNDRPISPIYLEGKIGGVPIVSEDFK